MERICNKCGLVKSKFKQNRKECWDCTKAYERERRKRKRELNEFIECKICATIKHSSEMSTSLSRTCDECYNIINRDNIRLKELKNQLSDEIKVCKMCKVSKHVTKFHPNSNKCKACINKNKRNIRRIKSLENELSTEIKLCSICKKSKHISKFRPSARFKCRLCENKACYYRLRTINN